MILDQIAWIDCIAFLVFLIPQLLLRVRFRELLKCAFFAVPFLVLKLPLLLIHERYLTSRAKRSPFVQRATLFQDVVIRCVRYAFADIPASIGKVFFSKHVALPFMRVRMIRNGVFKSPIYWTEVNDGVNNGLYAVYDRSKRPDIVIYYCHGGGFTMGSPYFYIEFLLAWLNLLQASGYTNPALYAIDYTLVPTATYPTQVQQTLAGYRHALTLASDSTRICVAGDSAGGNLILSLLLCLSDYSSLKTQMPGLAVLISPWTIIHSDQNRNTASDYLDAHTLRVYGSQYLGKTAAVTDPLVSPGCCKDLSWWRRAAPKCGLYFIYGKEEVFAPDIRDLVARLQQAGVEVSSHEEAGWIHAWPVVKLFLCNGQEERLSGLRRIVKATTARIERTKARN